MADYPTWCYYLRGVEGETWVTMTTYRTTHYTGQRLDMGTGTSQSQRAKLNFAEDASTVGSDNIGSKNGSTQSVDIGIRCNVVAPLHDRTYRNGHGCHAVLPRAEKSMS